MHEPHRASMLDNYGHFKAYRLNRWFITLVCTTDNCENERKSVNEGLINIFIVTSAFRLSLLHLRHSEGKQLSTSAIWLSVCLSVMLWTKVRQNISQAFLSNLFNTLWCLWTVRGTGGHNYEMDTNCMWWKIWRICKLLKVWFYSVNSVIPDGN